MNNPFRQNQLQTPFLSPLTRCRQPLPSIAAPFAVIIIGGLALVLVAGATFSGIVTKASGPASAGQQQLAAIPAETTTSPAQALQTSDPLLRPENDEAVPTPPVETTAQKQDFGSTAAIKPASTAPAHVAQEADSLALSFNAPIAESEGDIALLEVIKMEPLPADEASTSELQQDEPQDIKSSPAVVAHASSASGLKPASVNGAVNLRAAPNKNGEVLLVIPAGARIEAQSDCGWCAASYDGNQGFVYKSFISYH